MSETKCTIEPTLRFRRCNALRLCTLRKSTADKNVCPTLRQRPRLPFSPRRFKIRRQQYLSGQLIQPLLPLLAAEVGLNQQCLGMGRRVALVEKPHGQARQLTQPGAE